MRLTLAFSFRLSLLDADEEPPEEPPPVDVSELIASLNGSDQSHCSSFFRLSLFVVFAGVNCEERSLLRLIGWFHGLLFLGYAMEWRLIIVGFYPCVKLMSTFTHSTEFDSIPLIRIVNCETLSLFSSYFLSPLVG